MFHIKIYKAFDKRLVINFILYRETMVGGNSLKEFMNLLLELSMKIGPSNARLSALRVINFDLIIKVVP